jgi:hypothetical protein
MEKKTTGKIVSVSKQWWLKINTKAFRTGPHDGAIFPHIIKVKYTVDGKDYFKRKWYAAGKPVPYVGESVSVIYSAEKPNKAKII